MNLARLFLVFLNVSFLGMVPFQTATLLFVFFPFIKLGSAIFTQDSSEQKSLKKIYPKDYFIVPIDSALKIAGNFGEIRPNHFHAGIDIKTGGKEGLFVYAAADGYVSRIKVSPYGYGKAIYITHPNGYTTVYAHLQRFYGKIAKYLELEQYRLESFEVDLYPDKMLLPVKQRDTIGISGNTGGSQAPHLHFEVRDAITENACNPFLFGYKIEDTVPPVISLLKIYPANDSGFINGKSQAKKISVTGRKGKYKIAPQQILLHGNIGFGIETIDYANIREAGKLGVYSIDLYVNNKRIYYHEMNEIFFDETRYINSHIDYAEIANKKEIQKCFRDPNNMLSIYQCVVNEGIFRFDDTLMHTIKFIVKDFFGNASELNFQVKSSAVSPPFIQKEKKGIQWKCNEPNTFETDDIRIEIPPCGLYEDIDFMYAKSKDTLPGTWAPIHSVHNDKTPVHFPYKLSIRPGHVPEKLQSKATIVSLDGNNTKYDMKGKWENGWVSTEVKYFGRFTIAFDTVPPLIKPYNIYNGKNMKEAKTIAVIVKDNLTGIKSWRATIDGKWVLMEYEYKKAMLFHEFGSSSVPLEAGRHVFELTVTDGKDNSRTYRAEFTR